MVDADVTRNIPNTAEIKVEDFNFPEYLIVRVSIVDS